MCLIIDPIIHRERCPESKPIKRNSLYSRIFHKRSKYTIYANTADEDIHTIKYLLVDKASLDNKDDEAVYIAPYRTEFKYKLQKKYSVTEEGGWKNEYDFEKSKPAQVNEGFHSYVLSYLTANVYDCPIQYINVKCDAIIPKGAKYFLGTNDEIVSNEIIINRILKTVDYCGRYYKYPGIYSNKKSNKKKRKRRAKRR